jgi:hypothetical protein
MQFGHVEVPLTLEELLSAPELEELSSAPELEELSSAPELEELPLDDSSIFAQERTMRLKKGISIIKILFMIFFLNSAKNLF